MVCIHNGALFSHKEEGNSVTGKWMELEIIMVRKIIQTEKNKHLICSVYT
jgi:hypothetical protein